MTENPSTIDEYLAALDGDKRAALEKLRKTIKSAAPDAAECISYGIPAFKYRGMLVYFAAFKDHCSFFPASTAVIEAFKDELKSYSTSKGTIRFHTDKPLPDALIKKMVKARIAENEAAVRKERSGSKDRN
jgi:uncharacterized protein YdhG (YjbR/CyaY superfamily)